jgi:hypothetical protein
VLCCCRSTRTTLRPWLLRHTGVVLNYRAADHHAMQQRPALQPLQDKRGELRLKDVHERIRAPNHVRHPLRLVSFFLGFSSFPLFLLCDRTPLCIPPSLRTARGAREGSRHKPRLRTLDAATTQMMVVKEATLIASVRHNWTSRRPEEADNHVYEVLNDFDNSNHGN